LLSVNDAQFPDISGEKQIAISSNISENSFLTFLSGKNDGYFSETEMAFSK
jgi:hypothetical protein